MKTQEVPNYLKDFNKIFSELEYTNSAHTVWNDFLELSICGLAYGNLQNRIDEIFARYKKEHHENLWRLFEVLAQIYIEAKKTNEWIDPLGDYYEALSSKGHKQGFGQFFTPMTVCETIVHMTVAPHTPRGVKNLDPACGSGRLLLAFNHIYPDNFQFGYDLDRTCVMMTAINMCFHGAKGEVCWKDSLDITDHRLVYAVNLHTVNGAELPTIIEIPKEKSYIYASDMFLLNKYRAEKQQREEQQKEQQADKPNTKSKKEKHTLSLFS